MKTFRLCWPYTVALLLCFALATPLYSQDNAQTQPGQPRGHFVVLPPRLRTDMVTPATTPKLRTWNGNFTYQGTKYTYNMVGAAPGSNATVNIPVYIIPVKIVVTKGGTKFTFDPNHKLSNGNTIVQNTVQSPIFDATTTYTQGGVTVGTTQYIDAYQRANFWKQTLTHPDWHTLLKGPTVVAEHTLTVPASLGTVGTPFGFQAGLVDINWFDSQLPAIISTAGIQPNALPIFLTYDVYLTETGQCCIGGYHSSEGSVTNLQSYAEASYVDHPGAFSQDVSALSHEVGEWADDPLTVNFNGNNTPCGVLEVGDPLEGNPNFGGYHYVLYGFTYNLQDLVTLPYFGAPKTTSVNNWFTFQGESLSVCQNGS